MNSTVYFARSYALTFKPAPSLSLPTPRARRTSSRKHIPRLQRTQLSLAVDQFIAGSTDLTTRDYFLHDRACSALTWQEFVQIAQTCKAYRLSLQKILTVAAAESTKVDAPALVELTCTHDEITLAPTWQAMSAGDGCENTFAQLSRKQNSRARASASKSSTPQENYSSSAASDSPSPCSNSDNSVST